MKRRGFLGALLGLPAAVTVAAALPESSNHEAIADLISRRLREAQASFADEENWSPYDYRGTEYAPGSVCEIVGTTVRKNAGALADNVCRNNSLLPLLKSRQTENAASVANRMTWDVYN
nr:hypothetical protein [uncultured Rhodopila sp.]